MQKNTTRTQQKVTALIHFIQATLDSLQLKLLQLFIHVLVRASFLCAVAWSSVYAVRGTLLPMNFCNILLRYKQVTSCTLPSALLHAAYEAARAAGAQHHGCL
jgi:hypothetical protein